ncbi:MAG TPA: serine hydrolase [Polyangium sp.]|nr:serine hydrolase [Polyangium sp.]
MRTRPLQSFLFSLFFLGACGGPSPVVQTGDTPPAPPLAGSATSTTPTSPPAATPKDEVAVVKVDADTPMTTPSGATYIAPKGWTVTTKHGVVVLADPNREVSLTFVERKEQDGAAAIAAAWKQVKPDFARAVWLMTPQPGRNGWDAVVDVNYVTTLAEARHVSARAARKGDTWFVLLSDGTEDGWSRRRPQANIARQSFRAQGVVEESFKDKPAHTLDAARLQKLDAFLEESRSALKIPGLAVAIVQNGKVVLEKGYGVKELGKKAPVTPDTMFRIASMTKPLTSLMIAGLVDEGKFTWDTHVTELLPTFALGDAELTKRLSVRNILCACTGIPYDNVGTEFEYANVSPEKMLDRVKLLKPTTGFGETFQYSNTMIAAAGYVAAHAAEPKKPLAEAYEKTMKAKVFGPLGMKNTTFDAKVVARGDHASPHNRNAKAEMELAPSDTAAWITPLNPGGGAWSTVRDLSKVLLMELAKGKTSDGKQVISEPNLLARREPQSRDGENASYGLALAAVTSYGVRFYGHGGGLAGYSSNMFFLPDHGIGAVILANIGAPDPLVYVQFRRKLFELLFDGRDEAVEDLAVARKVDDADLSKEAAMVDFAPGRAYVERFVGTYEHPMYGKITIRLDGDRGVLDVGEWTSSLGKKKEEDGTEKLVATTPPWIFWPEFLPKEVNGKMALELPDTQRKVLFERVSSPDPRLAAEPNRR